MTLRKPIAIRREEIRRAQADDSGEVREFEASGFILVACDVCHEHFLVTPESPPDFIRYARDRVSPPPEEEEEDEFWRVDPPESEGEFGSSEMINKETSQNRPRLTCSDRCREGLTGKFLASWRELP